MRTYSAKGSFQLDSSLSEDSLAVLLQCGLQAAASDALAALTSRRTTAQKELKAEDKSSLDSLKSEISSQHPAILSALRRELVDVVIEHFE